MELCLASQSSAKPYPRANRANVAFYLESASWLHPPGIHKLNQNRSRELQRRVLHQRMYRFIYLSNYQGQNCVYSAIASKEWC